MMQPWQAIFDEYFTGRLVFGVIRGDDRSTLVELSWIAADDIEGQNSDAEFERRMAEARQEAAARNSLDEREHISRILDANS
jgi:hypothetical protein